MFPIFWTNLWNRSSRLRKLLCIHQDGRRAVFPTGSQVFAGFAPMAAAFAERSGALSHCWWRLFPAARFAAARAATRQLRRRNGQRAYKPGSVPSVAAGGDHSSRAPACAEPLATNPDGTPSSALNRHTGSTVPIRFCSRWGLPCRSCCQARGALLPHPFTLTSPCEAVCSLWHCP
jgi:hypothetical protein